MENKSKIQKIGVVVAVISVLLGITLIIPSIYNMIYFLNGGLLRSLLSLLRLIGDAPGDNLGLFLICFLWQCLMTLVGIFLGIWLMILDKLKTNTARFEVLFLSLLASIPLSLGVTELAFYVWSLT